MAKRQHPTRRLPKRSPGTDGFHPRLHLLFTFGGFLSQESERGVVLVAAAMLDSAVKDILQSFFIEGSTSDQLLSEKGGAIGEYFTRSNLAYALGLISKSELQRLLIVGELRNKFAHIWDLAEFVDVPDAKIKLEELTRCRGALPPDLRESRDPPERALFEYETVTLLSALLFRYERTVRRERHPEKAPT